MQENKQAKSHKYAPIKFPHTQLLLVLEQNKENRKSNNMKNISFPLFDPHRISFENINQQEPQLAPNKLIQAHLPYSNISSNL